MTAKSSAKATRVTPSVKYNTEIEKRTNSMKRKKKIIYVALKNKILNCYDV